MTKSQCYSEIDRNNGLINQYQERIDILYKEIEELNDTKSKVANMRNTLSSCKQFSVGKLSGSAKVSRINSKIVNMFCSNMNTLFSGDDYTGVNGGLGNAISTVEDEIIRKKNQIKDLQNQIAACRNRIREMYDTIERIEEEEREAAERAAAEQAAAEKAAAEKAAGAAK